MRLAVLEKIASNVGTLAFIWATVVILGGYAITMMDIDFWFVTVILVTEAARIFSRSHELEWQHQDAGTISTIYGAYQIGSNALFRSTRFVRSVFSNLVNPEERVASSKVLDTPSGGEIGSTKSSELQALKLKRTWSTSRVSLLPFTTWIFRAKHVSLILYWMQLASAILSIILAALRLWKQDFIRPSEVETVSNHKATLILFYSLTVFEALVFLLERAYWRYETSVKRILVNVNNMCGLSDADLSTTRRFFYDVYAKCLTESIFEGLKMDMVDYALTWLQSDLPVEQLGGLRLLLTFSTHPEFSEETLRTIGVRQGAVERLLEMITWKNREEQEIRKAAANLLCRLVKYNRNSIRVAAISGSIEGIFSLLSRDSSEKQEILPDSPEYIRQAASDSIPEKNLATHIVGLRILKQLAKDPLNCAKIGTTRGLLTRLVSFIDTNQEMLRNAQEPEERISIVKKSLELLNMLAGATGLSGKMLREEIARVVYTISNLRNILEYGEAHMMLQELAANILSSLAMDEEVRETIGRTGGILRNLWGLFFKDRLEDDGKQLRLAVKAGEALTLLALKSKSNCDRMLRLKVQQEEEGGSGGRHVVEALLQVMGDWELGHLSMRILRSFCAYTDDQPSKLRVAARLDEILKIATATTGRSQEAALGLVSKTIAHANFRRLFPDDSAKDAMAVLLTELLDRYPSPSTSLPRIRRYCVELAIVLTDLDPAGFQPAFEAHNFRARLLRVADTVSEVENYVTFSGAMGVTRHGLHMAELADDALAKLR